MTIFRFSASLLAISLLTSCSQNNSDRQLACDEIPGMIGLVPRATSQEQYALLQKCILKWGYRFSPAPGPNSEIAKAVVYRCSDITDEYFRLLAKEGHAPNPAEQQKLEQNITGMALMRVVQWRAGQCSLAPPKDQPEFNQAMNSNAGS